MMLTDDQLETLTGARRKSDQARWLQDHGWTYVLDIRGRPRVAVAHFLRQMGGADSRDSTRAPRLRLDATPPQK